MGNWMNPWQKSFDANLLDVLPNLLTSLVFRILSILIDVLEYWSKTSFVANIVLLFILVLNEAICFFIDSVISQVHAEII